MLESDLLIGAGTRCLVKSPALALPLFRLIQADTDPNGSPLLRRSPGPGKRATTEGLPVCRVIDSSGERLFQEVAAQLNSPFTQTWLVIGEMVRNLLAKGAGSGTGLTLEGGWHIPSAEQLALPWLFRVGSEPMPELGLWLAREPGLAAHEPEALKHGAEGPEMEDLSTVMYTCLTTDPKSVAGGFVEEIATHEFGHLLMSLLMPKTCLDPDVKSTRMHLTTAVTDRIVAFQEGWGDHFQPLALRCSQSSLARKLVRAFDPAPKARWTSQVEDELRHWGVPANVFVYEAAIPEDIPERSPETRYRYDLTNHAFLTHQLKSPERMTASEGVVASVFYRLATDEAIGGHYREAAFYEQFLPLGARLPDGWAPAGQLGAYVNANLKLLLAMSKLDGKPVKAAPIVDLVETCGLLFPDEREAFFRSFLETTALVTAAPEARPLWKRLTLAGRFGHIGEIRGLMKDWQALFDGTLASCLDSGHLAPLLGPEIWLRSRELKVGRGLWTTPDTYLTVDLNACSPVDLLNLGAGLSWGEAKAVVAYRDEHGAFGSLDQLSQVPGLSANSFRAICGCLLERWQAPVLMAT